MGLRILPCVFINLRFSETDTFGVTSASGMLEKWRKYQKIPKKKGNTKHIWNIYIYQINIFNTKRYRKQYIYLTLAMVSGCTKLWIHGTHRHCAHFQWKASWRASFNSVYAWEWVYSIKELLDSKSDSKSLTNLPLDLCGIKLISIHMCFSFI